MSSSSATIVGVKKADVIVRSQGGILVVFDCCRRA